MATAYNQAIIEEILRQQREAQGSPYQNLKSTVGKIGKTGKNMTTVGDYMKNNLSNPTLQKFGSNISSVGSKLSNGANTVNNVITPQNYFKGFAPKPFAALGQNAASGAVGNTAGSAIGNAIGSEVAGTTAGGSALTSAISEAAPMATASGLGAGMASGAGASAAGGSAAGAGAAAGPIGALVALGVMAATGANRKRAKKSGQALLSGLNKEGEAALEQTNQYAKNMQNQDYSQPMLPTANDGITGGVAPAEQLTPIQEYQNLLRNQGYDESVINGVPQGLNSGNQDIADWINQYNNGVGRNNPINIPQTEEEIAAARAGNFNVPTQSGNAEETVKQGLLDKFLNGLGDLATGYKENRANGFDVKNLQRDDSKSKMNRVGEALGTTARIAQNPLVQGLVAGGLSAALTGNPLYGLGQGYKFANNRAMSNVYGDVLKQYGVNVPDVGTFGNISGTDMRNIGNMAETHAWHEYLNQKNADELARKVAKDQVDKEYKEGRIQIQQQNANTNAYKAQNGSKVTHISNGGSKKNGSSSVTGTKNPNYNQALAQYYNILQSGDARKISYARQRFMQEIGIDPDTKIKQTAKKQSSASAPSSDEETFLKEIGW